MRSDKAYGDDAQTAETGCAAGLRKRFPPREVLDCFVFTGLLPLVLFPLANFVRNMSGSHGYFNIWRDYMFVLAPIGLILTVVCWFLSRDRVSLGCVRDTVKRNLPLLWFAALAAWMLISTAVTGYTYESCIGAEKSRAGLLACLCFFVYLLLCVVWRDLGMQKTWLAVFVDVGGLLSLFIVLDFYLLGEKYGVCYQNLVFYNWNHLAYFLLVVTVAAAVQILLERNRCCRITAIIAFACGEAALVIADTLGTLIGLAFGLIFMFPVLALTGRKRMIKWLAVICIAAVLIVVIMAFVPSTSAKHDVAEMIRGNIRELLRMEKASEGDMLNLPGDIGSGRGLLWNEAFRCIRESPIFGKGLDVMRQRLAIATDYQNNTVHNEFLEYATNNGLPALIFYICGILHIFIRGLRNRKKLTDMNVLGLCVAFAYLVSAVFGVLMFYTAPFMFVFLGLGYYREGMCGRAFGDDMSAPEAGAGCKRKAGITAAV